MCVFFLRSLSRVEKKYDSDDEKLLAVKLALEEWRH